jgi:hypothetical protein
LLTDSAAAVTTGLANGGRRLSGQGERDSVIAQIADKGCAKDLSAPSVTGRQPGNFELLDTCHWCSIAASKIRSFFVYLSIQSHRSRQIKDFY